MAKSMSERRFPHESMSEALERSLRNAKSLRAENAAVVAGARILAARIDLICETGFLDENGAQVKTSFVTNLGDDLIRTAPDLARIVNDTVKRVRRERKQHMPKYVYPRELLTVTRLSKLGNAGVVFRVRASDVAFVRRLDSQAAAGKAIFGGGYLLSDRKAAELKAAELKAAELKAAEDVTVWPLSEKEKRIIKSLAKNHAG